jgi:hypothetical protein
VRTTQRLARGWPWKAGDYASIVQMSTPEAGLNLSFELAAGALVESVLRRSGQRLSDDFLIIKMKNFAPDDLIIFVPFAGD